MRAFIVICFLAAANAAPQGYNYQQQQNNFQTGQGSFSPQNIFQNLKQQPSFGFNVQPQAYQQIATPTFGIPQVKPQQQYQQQQQAFQAPAAPIVTKDIYVHVAPEEPEDKYRPAPVPVAPPRKHYRIVFIKAPTPSVSSAALRVKQAPTEEKTIIYVLTKKPDPLDLQAVFQDVAPKQPSKPEVYFIKYKTQEEAQHAQRTIQAQYDQLGGTTQISDEGVAPVTSVIGALDQQQGPNVGTSPGGGFIGTDGGSVVSTSGSASKYLPPIVRI
ncbi:uncharacterized protein LOC119676579 [Teleopsis dalmanni]|uniref:uncharacterized protein LOC119676579 n=1 Tax=Teleopsis dalmanni TaxID=139649 RepID=UPI0018CF4AEA|nr:uncharacterized protein LOC119676579 [Teleopsis dalmanni]